MFLAVDIGNTNITFAIFNEKKVIKTFRLLSDKKLTVDKYLIMLEEQCKGFSINECAIGSVVEELSTRIKTVCDEAFGIKSFLFDKNSDFGMKVLLKNPKEVGIDRIANAYAAKMKHQLPIIIVDIGTATTFDILSKNGNFIGGVIMPGLNLQFKSLNLNTSKLPMIDVENSKTAIGDSTVDALLSGVIRGSACAIEGLIDQCEKELGGKATTVATGGHCGLISEYMSRKFDYIDSNLTLEGLMLLHELNTVEERF